MENNKRVMFIIISIIIVLSAAGVIYYLTNNKNNERYDNKSNNTTDNNDKIKECEKYGLYYVSEKAISKDYSYLISKLDYSNKNIAYCYEDKCSYKESNLLTKSMIDSGITSISSDFKAEIKDEKVIVTKKEKTITLDIQNVKSVKAIFSVQNGVNLFILDNTNNLYYYEDHEEKIKKIRSDVKDFDVFEGNYYISVIEPSEGQNITIAIHTTDDKLLVGHYVEESYYDIKNIDNAIIHSLDFLDIIVSQSNKYIYEKNDGKQIIVKEVFVSNNKLYLYTADKELIITQLGNDIDYCNMKYTKVKKTNVSSLIYDDTNNIVTVKFTDGSTEIYNYSHKIDI